MQMEYITVIKQTVSVLRPLTHYIWVIYITENNRGRYYNVP